MLYLLEICPRLMTRTMNIEYEGLPVAERGGVGDASSCLIFTLSLELGVSSLASPHLYFVIVLLNVVTVTHCFLHPYNKGHRVSRVHVY